MLLKIICIVLLINTNSVLTKSKELTPAEKEALKQELIRQMKELQGHLPEMQNGIQQSPEPKGISQPGSVEGETTLRSTTTYPPSTTKPTTTFAPANTFLPTTTTTTTTTNRPTTYTRYSTPYTYPSAKRPAVLPRNCIEALAKSDDKSGFYYLTLPKSNKRIGVNCYEGGWIVILSRTNEAQNFNRNWIDYIWGFGAYTSEFFVGLEPLHWLTEDSPHELLVMLQDSQNVTQYATASNFSIGNESESFALKSLGVVAGPAGDSLSYHLGMKFSTYDQDNDLDYRNCAQQYSGGWWYRTCLLSKLTGEYNNNAPGKGIIWGTFRGYENSLSRAVMMIRPTKVVPVKTPW